MSEAAESLEERIVSKFDPEAESQETDVSEDQEQELSQTETAEEPTEELAAEEEETSAQFEEVEFEGKRYQVPSELKDALMSKSDYTAKTTEAARLRDALTHQQQEVALFQEQRAFEQSVADDLDNLKMLDAYIKHQKDNTNWSEMGTDEIVRSKLELDQLIDQRNELANTLQGKRNEFNQKLEEERKKLKESANEALAKSIPNWGDEVQSEIKSFMLERGYTEEQVQSMSPLDYRIAWEASQYRKLQQGKAAAVKQAATAPPVVKPGSSKPMPSDVRDKLKFKKELDKANKSNVPEAQKARIIQNRLEQKLKRMS